MEIHFKTISRDKQRYDTTGDWWFDERGVLQVRCLELESEDEEFEYFLHEVVEGYLGTFT